MWQTDLTAIEESHKKTMEPQYPEYINFNKHMMVAKIMRKVLELQNGDYPLQPVGPLRDWLESQVRFIYPHVALCSRLIVVLPKDNHLR